jgi:hypothetical protein
MSTFRTQLNSGVEHYMSPRQEGEIDLVKEVRALLVDSGLAANLEKAFDNHHQIIEARDKPSQVQRYLMNRYWTTQLMIHANKTAEHRFFLIPNGSVQQWLELFKNTIIPFLVEHNLPVEI